MKLARSHTKRPHLIAFEGAFHGRTYAAVTLTTDVAGVLPIANGGTGIAAAVSPCTLNGGTPATCTTTAPAGCVPICGYGSAPNVTTALYCTISTTTVTAHDTATATATVNVKCGP